MSQSENNTYTFKTRKQTKKNWMNYYVENTINE